jgi:hypothetical protein
LKIQLNMQQKKQQILQVIMVQVQTNEWNEKNEEKRC